MAGPWEKFQSSDTAESEGPWTKFAKGGRLAEAAKMVTDIPSEIGHEYSGAVQNIKQFGEYARGPGSEPATPQNVYEGIKSGASALGSAAYLGTGIGPALVGAAKSIYGHGMTAIMPEEDPNNPLTRKGGYEAVKGDIDTILMGVAPGKAKVGAVPIKPQPEGEFGVTTQKGPIPPQGQISARGKERVTEFQEQQKAQVESAKERISKSFDVIGKQKIAETPGQAGELISEGVRRQARNAKEGTAAQYKTAKSYAGEIPAAAFDNIGPAIKQELSLGQQPIIISDQLTPYASQAIRNVEERIAQLKIQNRASPHPVPGRNQIAGVSLEGVEQMRKGLSAYRQAAYATKNESDIRATQAVLDAFDNHIDKAVNSGAFQGDPRAIKAWNYARASYSEMKKTYGGKYGTVGGVVQKIIGGREKDPAVGNDVADFIYGGTGVNPNTLNVGVARRVKEILGESSPEWAAARQGLFERIVTPVQGEYKPTKVADRIERFIKGDGRELADVMYSPQERGMLLRFADLHRQLDIMRQPVEEGLVKRFAERIYHRLNLLMAGAIGHFGMHGMATAVPMVGVAKGTEYLAASQEVRKISKQLPLVSEQMANWYRAVKREQARPSAHFRRLSIVAMADLVHALNRLGIATPEPIPRMPPKDMDQAQYGGPQQ